MEPDEIVNWLSRNPHPETRAKKARRALEALRDEIGSQPWLERAIISCDALDDGRKLDKSGRPLRPDGDVQTWESMGV